eukprot:TRINITY_DN13829_c0_g1_i1.p1 TRINITY_DN13829_c0_g1~~TRINITY_DN13829_c0_g1_i1.p1  ORF type:complete len:299 (+),score=40.36 TRINITY_DN13829_c0_g1_i1:59-955(+)
MRSYESNLIEWNYNPQNTQAPSYSCSALPTASPLSCVALPTVSKNEKAIAQQQKPEKPDDSVYLSKFELEILKELNSCRTDPQGFIPKIKGLRKFYKKNNVIHEPGEIPIRTREGKKGLDEAIKFLETQAPLLPLKLTQGLLLAAQDHIADCSFTGVLGEVGSDLSTPITRVRRYGQCGPALFESEVLSRLDPLQIVVQLLVDDGNLTRSNRDKMFNSQVTVCGVATGGHPKELSMCVVVFSDRYINDKMLISMRDSQREEEFLKARCAITHNKRKTMKLHPKSAGLTVTQEAYCVIS